MGYEKEADEIQRLFMEGKRAEAVATVPTQVVDDISLVGPAAKIRDDLPRWEESGVTSLVISPSTLDEMRQVAEVILG
jgi:hypothetical protein